MKRKRENQVFMRPVAWFGFLTNEQMFTSSINVQLSSKKMRGSLRQIGGDGYQQLAEKKETRQCQYTPKVYHFASTIVSCSGVESLWKAHALFA